MSRIVLCALSLSLCWGGSNAFGQAAFTEVYGEGVHRFFAGDLVGAERMFSEVINSGSEDPRAYYFRGLVRSRQGGGGEMDFETGARMEAEGKQAVQVGFALSRIQGSVRAKIEKARRDARVMASQQALLMQRARMEMAPPSAAVAPETLAPSSGSSVPADPFLGDEGMRGDTSVDPVQPTTPEIDSTSNPFGDDPAPAVDVPTPDAPAGDDPFNPTPAPSTDSNPFDTGSGEVMDDPFK
jgi:hypothetical protein